MIYNFIIRVRSCHQSFKIRFIKVLWTFWALHIAKFSHHRKLICWIIQIIEVLSIRVCITRNTCKPGIFIWSIIFCSILIQSCNFLHISIIKFTCGTVTEQEIHMIHCSIDFNTVTIHTFYINVRVTRVNVIPFSINLNRIPEMYFTKGTFLTKHSCICIIGNTNHINDIAFINVQCFISVCICSIVQFIRSLPVFWYTHVGSGTILTIVFRTHILYNIRKRFGITGTYTFSLCKDSDMVTFPGTDDTFCKACCSLLSINWNSFIRCHSTKIVKRLIHLIVNYFFKRDFNLVTFFIRCWHSIFHNIIHCILCNLFNLFLSFLFSKRFRLITIFHAIA